MNSNKIISPKQDLLITSLHTFYSNENNINTLLPIINGESKISLRVIDWFVTNYSKKNNIYYLIVEDGTIETEFDNLGNKKYKQFVVYIDYKLQLKGYQKKQFDPFCRRERIEFNYNPNDKITTTVGQLNFFRWAISNKILNYIEKNLKEIENDMNSCYKAVYNVNKDKKLSKKSSKFNSNDNTPSGSVVNSPVNNEDSFGHLDSNKPDLVDIEEVEENNKTVNRRKRHQLSVSATKSLSKSNVKIVVSFD